VGKFTGQFFRAHLGALSILPALGIFCYPFGNGLLNYGDMLTGLVIAGTGAEKFAPSLSIGIYPYGIPIITLIFLPASDWEMFPVN
jgi:hypothetical protein